MYKNNDRSIFFALQAGMGVIGDTNTAVRDPIFYRLHATTERLFRQHKDLLSPYSVEEVSEDRLWKEVE